MDTLSNILDGLEMKSSLYFATEFREPWSIEVPADSNVCRFHVIVHGPCRVTVPSTGDTRVASKGDLVLVPHGSRHLLQCIGDVPPTPLPEVMVRAPLTVDGRLRWGGEGTLTRLVCGHFAFDGEVSHPILEALPPIVHVEAAGGDGFGWIENVMKFIGQEAGSGKPGSGAISRRLSEILFIQVVRRWAETAPSVPVLSAIVDPNVGRAMHAMHADPGRAWTVESLAREAALSRTVFAQRFTELAGATPMKYLTDLRMRSARRLLAGPANVAVVGDRVGYRSEAAFNRAFTKAWGIGPGAYRRSVKGEVRQAAPDVTWHRSIPRQ